MSTGNTVFPDSLGVIACRGSILYSPLCPGAALLPTPNPVKELVVAGADIC